MTYKKHPPPGPDARFWIFTALVVIFVLALIVVVRASAAGSIAAKQARAKPIICAVFGPYCREALAVAWCESRHYIWAVNGQYRGLFQMGSWERTRYGHAPGAWAQARAARRYFVASGRDWSPWSCKP
jgi:hypothetical protein